MLAALVDQVRDALGPIDVLVANAGLAKPAEWEQVDAADYDRTMAGNLRAPFLLAKAALPAMRQRGFGRVLFVSSTAAIDGGMYPRCDPAAPASVAGLGLQDAAGDLDQRELAVHRRPAHAGVGLVLGRVLEVAMLGGTGQRDLHRGQELRRLEGFDEVPDGAGVGRLLDQVLVGEGREHQHRGTALLGDVPGGRDPVHLRHLDVHDHQVRAQITGELDRLLPVAGLAHNGVAAFLQRLDDVHPDQDFVLGHKHSGHLAPLPTTSTSTPAPRTSVTSLRFAIAPLREIRGARGYGLLITAGDRGAAPIHDRRSSKDRQRGASSPAPAAARRWTPRLYAVPSCARSMAATSS